MKRLISLAALVVLATGTLVAPGSASEGNPNPGVLSPHSKHPYGIPYREWGSDWFEWAFEAPVATSPEVHPDNCGPGGESEHVWFLAVSLGGYTTADCTVPARKGISFIAGGAFCSPAVGDPQTTYDGLRRCALDFLHDHVSDARVTIDGRRLEHIGRYLTVSRLIHLRLPADNLFGDPAGTYPLVVAQWLFILHPLSVGQHTITTFDRLDGSPAAMTYRITVVPHT